MSSFDVSLLKGNDVIEGSPYADRLYGRAGNDVITGNLGKDILYGGAGADRFVFESDLDSWAILDFKHMDTIADFSRKQRDKIDLRPIDANTTRGGNQKFTFTGLDDFTGKPGELAIARTKAGSYVAGDTDGDTIPQFTVFVKGSAVLVKGDFYL